MLAPEHGVEHCADGLEWAKCDEVDDAWKGTMTQYAGRLHRHHDAKHEIRIIDYVDREVPVLRRMFAKRQRTYTSLGYHAG